MSNNVLVRLLASRKFVVVLLGMLGVVVLAGLGKVDGPVVADVLKWAISAYAIGTGLEGLTSRKGGVPSGERQ